MRSSTSARTRSSSTSPNARADGAWQTIVDRAEVTRLGEGLDETGRLERRADGREPSTRSPRWPTRRGATASSDRRGRHGRAADRGQQRGVPRRCRERAASRSRSSPARRRAGSRTWRRRPGSALGRGTLVVFDTGGGSSQFTFGRGRARRRALQRQRRRRAIHRTIRPGGAVSEDTLSAALAAIAADLARLDGRRRTRSSGWAARSRTSPP